VLGALLVLDPGVEVLGRLADDDQVDVLVARTDARIALARADLAVEVECLPQGHVHRPEAAPDRSRDRALQGDSGPLDRVEDVIRKRIPAEAIHHVRPRLLDVPVELDAGRLQDAARRLGQLRAGAVAGNQRHLVGHGRGL
jgi:hypothetical protein